MARTATKNTAAGVGLLGAAFAFFLKFKVAIFGLFKSAWLLKASWTMLLSFGIYAAAFGWQWALVVIGLIYVHEMGHFLFMKVKGLKPKAPVFVPFMGAYVAMTNLPEDPVIHAWVAYAGPLVGGLAAAGLYSFGMQTGSRFIVSAAHWGFIINLLQLVPVRPFDGGFISECISKWLALPGIILLVVVALAWHSPLLILITVVSLVSTYKRLRYGSACDKFAVRILDRSTVTIAYFSLAWALGYLYWLSGAALGQPGSP